MAGTLKQRIVPYLLLPAGIRSDVRWLPVLAWVIPLILLLPNNISFFFRELSKINTNFGSFFNERNYELSCRSSCFIRAVILPTPIDCRKSSPEWGKSYIVHAAAGKKSGNEYCFYLQQIKIMRTYGSVSFSRKRFGKHTTLPCDPLGITASRLRVGN